MVCIVSKSCELSLDMVSVKRRNGLLKTLLILVLLACFGIQVWEGVVKFFKSQTTIAAITEHLSEAELPVLSFCPGYRDSGVDYYEQMDELEEILRSLEGR